MRTCTACATIVFSIVFLSSAALGQSPEEAAPAPATTAPPASPAAAVEQLPEVEIVQETPVQKAARAKKQAVAVSPLSSAPTIAPTAPGTQQSLVVTTALPTVPSAVTNVTDTEIEREGTASIQQALQQQVPGVIISDAAGNPLRAEVSFRGFDASPVAGRAQGLAVYQNGVRINEAFGDTVYWDVLPSNAIASMSVVSNNPSFGLNALGGAVSILMKDGFSYQGAEIDLMAGSFGRRQVGVEAGAASSNAAIYVATEALEDDGFRDFSDSEVKRFYGDVGLKGTFAELHFNVTAADNSFGVTTAAPVELLQRDWSNTFTSPQVNSLEVFMPTLSASVKATSTLTLSGVGYYRHLKNNVIDGNVTEIEPCEPPEDDDDPDYSGFLCLEQDDAEEDEDPRVTAAFGPVPDDLVPGPLGSIERLNTESRSWGGVVEAVEKAPLFDRPNQFLVGVSYDSGRSNYTTSSELGTIGPKYVVAGSGVIVTGPLEIAPRDLDAENTYWGLYFSDAIDVTDQLTVTIGGRYNRATIELKDNTGLFPGLNATNTYERFNPMAGANYKLAKGVSLYGGYSESNRAPTPAELGCSDPAFPCLIESFLTDDPPLEQVVGRTAEIGLRGQGLFDGGSYTWSAGLFRTLASDDIMPIIQDNRIFFVNGGDTLRQGLELSATYATRTWQVYVSYALVDATLDACTNPDEDGLCAFLEAGDRLPGIPRHRFKTGFDYWVTSKWKVGADLVAASDQPFFPNDVSHELGLDARLDSYTRVDLHTSYDLNKNVQFYGLIKNLFNEKYGLYGTYFEAGDVSDIDIAIGGSGLTDARSISPSMPFAIYGGVKIKLDGATP